MKKLFTDFTKVVEIIPPTKNTEIEKFFKSIKILKEVGVNTVSIVSNPMGKPKLPALYIAQCLIQQGFKVIVHYPLSGRSEVVVESDMLQAASIGVDIILVLSGDSHGQRFQGGMCMVDAIELVKSHNIIVGVAADPNNINHEYLKAKVDAGADYFQTQPIFTVDCALRFLKEISRYRLPVLMGIMIPKSKSHLEKLSQIPGIVIPDEYLKRFREIKPEEIFIVNALEQASKVINAVKKEVDGVYLSIPQSMFVHIKEMKWTFVGKSGRI